MEAAHVTWRPLGRLLVDQGMLTAAELEHALARQQETGKRLGETIVECGFVSGPELASALAAQYGIELTTEQGFGTGLRSEIQRRHENDRRRVVQLVPDPPTLAGVPDEPPAEDVPEEPESGEAQLLAQLEEQWAKLAAAEAALAERERELSELSERHAEEIRRLEGLNDRLRTQIEAFRHAPDEPTEAEPRSHVVFVQLGERYELLLRDGPPPPPSTPLELPDVEDGTFVVTGRRRSPLPGDARPCIVVQRG